MKELIGRIALAGMLVLQSSLLPAAENVTVPGQVQFAGRILTTEDTEGTRGVTFSLFAEQSGGAALWVENQNVSVSGDGGYNTLLGAETQGGIPQSIFASGEARWLEVSYTGADGATITQPRVLLVSVPYALKAGDAATLGGLPVSAFVLNADAVASRVSDNGGLPGATVTDVLPTAAVTAGRIAKFNSALATDVVDSIITESSGKIGIGTTTPVGTIDVGGWASIPGDIQGVGSTISGDVFMGNTNGGIGRFRMASNALQGFFSWNQYYNGTNHKGMDATAPGWRVNIGGTGAEDAYYVERSPATAGGHVPARLFVVNGNGRVAINTGTAAPLGTLDVGGWPDIPGDIVGVGSTISGDAFMGNVGGNAGRYRMASNGNQGFFSWNQYYNGTVHKGMDATAPGWRINVGGKGVEDAFYVERSPATAGTHVPARLFQVSGSGNVGIGTIAPTAKLDVVGTVKATGFQLVDGNQAASKVLTSDANGNATWQDAPGGGGGATLGANTFTATQTISSGNLALPAPGGASSGVITSDGARFIYRRGTSNAFFGFEAGNFTGTGVANTAVGWQSMQALTSGTSNTAVGIQTLKANTTGNANTAVGDAALFANISGINNTAVGAGALLSNTVAFSNTAVGTQALGANTTGSSNTGVGGEALRFNVSGIINTAVGRAALRDNTSGGDNTAVGASALQGNIDGNWNTALGGGALSSSTSASDNTAVGSSALTGNTTGVKNVAVGRSAGYGYDSLNANTTGSLNTFIGYEAGPSVPSATSLQNATAIGANAAVGASNALVLGSIQGVNGAASDVNVGIGTSTPDSRLQVRNSADTGGVIHVGGTSTATGTIRRVRFGDFDWVYVGEKSDTDDMLELRGLSGIYLNTPNSVGIGTSLPQDKLHVAGDIRVGTGTTGCVKDSDGTLLTGICSSDARFKKNITSFTASLSKVAALRPVHYDWRADEFSSKHFGTARSFGLIAQEVEQVLPELVTTDADGYKAVNYSQLPLYAIQAVKELKAENDKLQEANEYLQAQLADLQRQLASQQTQVLSKAGAQQSEIGELREMLMSLQRQLGTQVSKAVTSGQ